MSNKSPNNEEEEDIYSDLPDFQYDDTLKKLETSKNALEEQVAKIQKQLQKLYEENKKLNEVNHNLAENISSLYKTANNELKRKDRLIQELRDENDKLIFRKKRFQPKQEYSAGSKDIGSEEKNYKSENLDTCLSANNCPYKEEVRTESLVCSQNVSETLLRHTSEQTAMVTVPQANINSSLKSGENDVNFDVKGSEIFSRSNEQKVLNRETKFSIKSNKNAMKHSESPEIYSRLEKPSPKPEYFEKPMAHQIKEISSKYSSRSSSVKMANTVKSKYSKSRSSHSKTPFDKSDYRPFKVSRGRSPHRRDFDRQPDLSIMRSMSRYSRSRSPPRRNKNYDTNNRYHYSHSKERKYDFKVHNNSLDKFVSKHENSCKNISSTPKLKERETSKYSMPQHSRHEDKMDKSSYLSKSNVASKSDYEIHKSKVKTFPSNDIPIESKRNMGKENVQKTEAEHMKIKSNDLEHSPTRQDELKYTVLTDAKLIEVNETSVNAHISSNRLVESAEQQVKESTFIAVNKTNSSVTYDKYKDIVEKNVTHRENLEMKCHKANPDEDKSNFQSPVKEKECNINSKTSPTLQDPAIFKGGNISICMFNEQVNFTRKRKRAKLIITNKPSSNLPVDPEFISVSSDRKGIINNNDKSAEGKQNLKHDNKHLSNDDCQNAKKFKWSSEVESLHIMECNSEQNNASNNIQNEKNKISHNTNVQISKISSIGHLNVPGKPKILTMKHEDSRKNNELLNSHYDPAMILTTNEAETVEKSDCSGEENTFSDGNISSLSKSLVSNKENINSTVASKDKSKLFIGKVKNSTEFSKDISLEEGEIIDENSPDESGVGLSNVDDIPLTKVDREKIKERTNQRRSSANSRRSNSITRQTTRVKNTFGNNICERRSPSELFTGDKSVRKINKKRDSHSKIIRSESQHPDDDNMQGNRTSEKRKTTCNETKLKQKDSKSENRSRPKSNNSHLFKISEIDVDNLTNENVSIMKMIQNVDKEHTDYTDIKMDVKREKLKERNQKALKQQLSSIEVKTNVLNNTASKENVCFNMEKRKIKSNKLCDINQEKFSLSLSDAESLNNKSVPSLKNLISDDPINNIVKDEKAQHTFPEKQEMSVSDKYSSTAKIFDRVESITNVTDISCDIDNLDTNANKVKSDIHVVNNVSDRSSIYGTSSDTGFTSQEGNDSSVQAQKRKNARMTRSKMNTHSTKGKINNYFSGQLVNGSSDGLQPINCTSSDASVLNKVIETPSFPDCLSTEVNENVLDKVKSSSHSTSSTAKPLNHIESKKHVKSEIPSQVNEPKNNEIGIEKLATSSVANQYMDIKKQRNANFDPGINKNCNIHAQTSLENNLNSLEEAETSKLSEIEIKSPLLTPDSLTNQKIGYPTSQVMSSEELMKILAGSPPSAKKNSAVSNDEKLSIEKNVNLKTPEPSQQPLKTKTIIMHRRTRVHMLQDSPIHTFTISSKFDSKISSTNIPQNDRKNGFINEGDVTPQKKLQDSCALSKVTVIKDTAQVQNSDNSDITHKSAFTNHTKSNMAIAFSDVFGSDTSEDSSDNSDDSIYIPKKQRHVGKGQIKKKKKIIKVKIKTQK